MVYFLLDRRRGLVKIGQTCRLKHRLREQNVFDDPDVVFIGVMEGERNAEYHVHEYVSWIAERVKKTDWFRLNEQLAAFIDRCAVPVSLFDWHRDASTDGDPFAPTVVPWLVPWSFYGWINRLRKHVGMRPVDGVLDVALREFAASRGFAEPMPDFPLPNRKSPLFKKDKRGGLLLQLDNGSYVPAVLPQETEDILEVVEDED